METLPHYTRHANFVHLRSFCAQALSHRRFAETHGHNTCHPCQPADAHVCLTNTWFIQRSTKLLGPREAPAQFGMESDVSRPLPVPKPRSFPIVGTAPGPRCGHTLTAIAGPDGDLSKARLILFGALYVVSRMLLCLPLPGPMHRLKPTCHCAQVAPRHLRAPRLNQGNRHRAQALLHQVR